MSGHGKLYSYGMVYDSSLAVLQADQPYNVAVIELERAHHADTEPWLVWLSGVGQRASGPL